ncbi:MAG: hypothetical protein IPM24_28225 [Bryobacterales bacterium]|nr:hypothetical protein [Bryobacterales bacterium]
MDARSLLLLLPLAVSAQVATDARFEGRPAIRLSNEQVNLTVLPLGGAFVELTLAGDPEKLSPLWNPVRYPRGGQPHRGFSLGHFVCVDGFGPVSPEEQKAGLTGHGEAHALPWKLDSSGKRGKESWITQSVELPILRENYSRTVRLVDGENVVAVESTLENLLGFDRPVVWAEHATIGKPFLAPEVTVVDQSAGPSQTRPYRARPGALPHRLPSGMDFTWPFAPTADGGRVDLRAVPNPPNSGDHTTTLMDPTRPHAFVTALHLEKRLLLGYVFRREEFPWLQIWEFYPPDGNLARGLEFSTQPYDVSRRDAISTGSLFGAPTYRWLPAKSKISSRFLMFYTRVPEGFRGVDDIRLEGGKLIIEDRRSGRKIELASSVGL